MGNDLKHCMCGCIYEEADCPNCNKVTEADRIEELEAKLAKAVEALEFVDGKVSWEINPSNYDHDDVCNMNSDWCEIGNHAEITLAELKGEK